LGSIPTPLNFSFITYYTAHGDFAKDLRKNLAFLFLSLPKWHKKQFASFSKVFRNYL